MPADPKHCKALIGRLAPLPGFPREYPTAITGLIETLAKHAENDAHADAIMATITDSAERCPVFADLIRVAHETREVFTRPKHVGCPACVDGWREVLYLITTGVGRGWKYQCVTPEQARILERQLKANQRIDSAVEQCSCVRGRKEISA